MNMIYGLIGKLSIAQRILAIAGIAVVGLLVMFASYFTTNSIVSISLAESERNTEIAALVNEVEIEALTLRRREKDFLLRLDEKYLAQYIENFETIMELAEELRPLVHDNEKADLEVLIKVFPEHRQVFENVVRLTRNLGYSEDQGLQGTLRAAVKKIEANLAPYNNNLLTVTMLMMRRHEKDFIMRKTQKYIDSMASRKTEFENQINAARIPAAGKTTLIEELDAYLTSFNEYAATVVILQNEIPKLSAVYQGVSAPMENLLKVANIGQAVSVEETHSSRSSATYYMVLIGGIIIVLTVFLSWVISGMVVKPIRNLQAAVVSLADGNNETHIPGQRFTDELGDMSRSIEVLRVSAVERVRLEKEGKERRLAREAEEEARAKEEADREQEERDAEAARTKQQEDRATRVTDLINAFDSKAKQAMEVLTRSAGEMRNSAKGMVTVSQNTETQAQTVTEAANTTNENVQSVAAASEEFTQSIGEVNRQVSAAREMTDNAVTAAIEGGESVKELSVASEKIGDIISLINDIAEQTNLLALNATIEAARAGEAGRGFAVVASEVKSLATQTAGATDEITTQISSMKSVTDNAVTAIGEINSIIEGLNEIMVGISAAIEEQEATTAEMGRSTQYAAESTQQVSREITEVSAGARETGAASSQVLSAAEELEKVSEDLGENVTTFCEEVQAV